MGADIFRNHRNKSRAMGGRDGEQFALMRHSSTLQAGHNSQEMRVAAKQRASSFNPARLLDRD